jgi:Zn-dependent M28 family amino/carboxypeptidase
MPSAGIPGMNYVAALPYRLAGATRASALGAVAVLVRSLTAATVGGPHTGTMRYGEATTEKIPAAAVSIADADRIAQLVGAGQTVKVRLSLGAKTLPDVESANVIAEIRGREKPDEIVLIGGHLDSWDVGQGAQDDGAECTVVMQTLTLLRKLGLVPRRTLRAVLFTNEENGGRGAIKYAIDHQSELRRHVAAIESDNGAGALMGLMTNGVPCWTADARALAELALPAGANAVIAAHPGEDIQGLKTAGVPLLGFLTDMDHYFDVHHSSADTLDRVKPENLRRWVAALATTAFVLADRQETWTCKDETPSAPSVKP